MSDEITFEDPPENKGGSDRVSHAIIAAQLRERPRQWALTERRRNASSAGNGAQAIRSGRIKAYVPAGAYEAMARTVDEIKDGERVRTHRIYARYVGEEA